MSETETRATPPLAEFLDAFAEDDNEWWRLQGGDHLNLFEELLDERDAARAEVSRLRGVVEAVQALADEWDEERRPGMVGISRSIRAVLAPVSSSGEAGCPDCGGSGVVQEAHDGGTHPVHCRCTYAAPSSGEAESGARDDHERGLYGKYRVTRISDPTGKHADCRYFVLDPQHDPHAVTALRAYAAACATGYPALAADLRAWAGPAPVPSGGQADGEGVRLRPDEIERLDFNYQVGDGRWLYEEIEGIIARRLAARPVLSREALVDLLVQQTVRVQVPNVGTVTGFLRRESADALADVLTAGGEQA